jgi:hypothetical protein
MQHPCKSERGSQIPTAIQTGRAFTPAREAYRKVGDLGDIGGEQFRDAAAAAFRTIKTPKITVRKIQQVHDLPFHCHGPTERQSSGSSESS